MLSREDLVDQPDAKPTRKVAGATLGGAILTLALVVLNAAGVELPGAVDLEGLDAGAAITTLVVFISGWSTRERR